MSSLKDKMYNYEMTPPANTWEKVSTALDELQESNDFSKKIQNIEITPPKDVWEKISSGLDDVIIIPIERNKKLSTFLRYAAAAVVLIGLITFGAIKFSSKTSGNSEVAKKDNNASTNDSIVLPNAETSTENLASTQTDEQRDDAALEESKKTYAKLDLSENSKQKIRNSLMMKPAELISSSNSDRNYPEVCFPDDLRITLANSPRVNTSERYVMLMTPDGNIIRMSKKWADLLCCVSGEDEDEACKDQLKKWREKIANAPVAPSPGNFMDILSLVESLHNNN
jgi:hypothetical protein